MLVFVTSDIWCERFGTTRGVQKRAVRSAFLRLAGLPDHPKLHVELADACLNGTLRVVLQLGERLVQGRRPLFGGSGHYGFDRTTRLPRNPSARYSKRWPGSTAACARVIFWTHRGPRVAHQSRLASNSTEKFSQSGSGLLGLVLELVHELGSRFSGPQVEAPDRVLRRCLGGKKARSSAGLVAFGRALKRIASHGYTVPRRSSCRAVG